MFISFLTADRISSHALRPANIQISALPIVIEAAAIFAHDILANKMLVQPLFF